MPHSPRVKALAQKLDPECWISYSGKEVSTKQAIDVRRCAALAEAQEIVDHNSHRINEYVNRCMFAHFAFGRQAGKTEFNKVMKEIEDEKRPMIKLHGITRDMLFALIREVAIDPKLGRSIAYAIMCDHGGGAKTATQIPSECYEDVYKALRKAKFMATRKVETMPLLKIRMMLHFATVLGPFAPEPVRRSEAYVTFVRELLRDGMIERPTTVQRNAHPGWAYKATPRGQCYVKTIEALPLPVRTNPEWEMPARK